MTSRVLCSPGKLFFLGCGWALSPEPLTPFPIFPNHEYRSRIEYGGVRSAEYADQQDGYEVSGGHTTEEQQRQQSQHHRKLCVDRAVECLNDGVIDQ